MTKGPLLTLETLAPERPYITIDEVDYDLALVGDFGLVDQAALSRMMSDAAAIQAEVLADTTERPFGATSEDAARRATQLLDEIVQKVVRAPTPVLAALDDRRKLMVIEAFRGTLPGAATASETESRSTSGPSPRPSRRSTAPATG